MSTSKESKNWDLVINRLPEKIYKINISPSTQEKINSISQFLTNNPKINCIYYFNHISYPDPLFVGHIIGKLDPNKTRPIIVPVSYSHSDPHKLKNVPSIAMLKLANSCGVDTSRVVQRYQVENAEFDYNQIQAQKTYRNLAEKINDYKKNNLSFSLAISPEGHRSDTGTLGKAEKGIIQIARHIQPVLLIPIAIYYDNKFKRSGINLGKNVNLEIGKQHLYDNQKEKDIDFYMENLALALPPKMRGRYNQEKSE